MDIARHHQTKQKVLLSQAERWPAVALLSFGTALPAYRVEQMRVSEWMASSLGKHSATSRLLHSLHANSGIDSRYSCCPDYLHPATESRFAPGHPLADAPTTAERMAIYTREAPPLGIAAAQRALDAYAEKSNCELSTLLASITHLVVVSCTGFFAPGLDFVVARELNLAPTVQRTLIGFMGCSAAFNGLHAAYQSVRSQPDARVLVVCVELCSLHNQPNPGREQLAAYALFSDGAAACLVGQPQPDETDFFQLENFHTSTMPDTQSAMAWVIGDHGFTLKLSPQVPHHLAAIAPEALRELFVDSSPQFWAIHPGGRAIVDRLAEIFDLSAEQVAPSRAILQRYGNLSSVTILFVLDELHKTLRQTNDLTYSALRNGHGPALLSNGAGHNTPLSGVAMAFGPGLVVEMARLAYVPLGSRERSVTSGRRDSVALHPGGTRLWVQG